LAVVGDGGSDAGLGRRCRMVTYLHWLITISAIMTVIMTLLGPHMDAEDEPLQDHHSGSLTLA